MSGWSWALMALSGQCGTEMSMAGLEIASKVERADEGTGEKSLVEIEMPSMVFQDDAAPVLKVYYDAQPG